MSASYPSVLTRFQVGDMLSANKKLSSSSPRISVPRCALGNKSPPRASAASRACYFVSRETEKKVLQNLADKSAGRTWVYHSIIPPACQAKNDTHLARSELASARDRAKNNSSPDASKRSSPRSACGSTARLSPIESSHWGRHQHTLVWDSRNENVHLGNTKPKQIYTSAARGRAMITTTLRKESGVLDLSSTTQREEGFGWCGSPSSGTSARRNAGKSAHVPISGTSKGSNGEERSLHEAEGDSEPSCERCVSLQKQVDQLQESNEFIWVRDMDEPSLLLELEALREKVRILEGATNNAFVGVCTKCSYLREIAVRQQKEIEAINLENAKLVRKNRAINTTLVQETDSRSEENAAHQAAMRDAFHTLQSFG